MDKMDKKTALTPVLSLLFCVIGLIPFSLNAQSYFQQEVNYKIDVSLDDTNHTLRGFIEMEYTNNSSDQLDKIFIHLWPNAYRNKHTALAQQMFEEKNLKLHYADDFEKGYIDSLDFKVNDQEVTFEYHTKHIDIGIIHLTSGLKPGQSIRISTPFFVKIPKGHFSRLGHIGQSYQITQWYPKPAVYDKDGWHEMPYLNQGEFYSEYGSFDVSITLPENYVVGATGDLFESPEEEAFLNERAKIAEKGIQVVKDTFPPSSEKLKTIRYKQKDVHDFAWFADKRFHVLKGEVKLPNSGRKVTTWSMFTNSQVEIWKNTPEYLHDAVYYYSLWLGDYPYNQVSAVHGPLSAGAGMEYPNITIIGDSETKHAHEIVTVHEVGHNWFYGILGSNERAQPWIDEGFNSYYENRYMTTKYPDLGLGEAFLPGFVCSAVGLDKFPHDHMTEVMYLINARRQLDQPTNLPANQFTSMNYGAVVYMKSAMILKYLENVLGTEEFDKTMQTFYEEWKFKHPNASNIEEIFKEHAEYDGDLDWFFRDLVETNKKQDYKIKSLRNKNDSLFIKIKNKGEVTAPMPLYGIKDDSAHFITWLLQEEEEFVVAIPNDGYEKVSLDPHLFTMDYKRFNNEARTSGILKTSPPLKLSFLGKLEDHEVNRIYFTPVAGFNHYDGFSPGVSLYNNTIPLKNTEFQITPLYGTRSNRLNGIGRIAYYHSWRDEKAFHYVSPMLDVRRFSMLEVDGNHGFFFRVSPELRFLFKNKELRSPVEQRLRLRHLQVHEDFYLGQSTNYFNELTYSLKRENAISPFFMELGVQQADGFEKVWAELNYDYQYHKSGKKISVRMFGGKFISNDSENARYNWQTAGQNGYFDYTYDHTFLGRNEMDGFYSRQFILNHGGFKVPTHYGSNNDWMVALNLDVDVPFPIQTIGTSVYFDAGFVPVQQQGVMVTDLIFNGGVSVNIANGFAQVYIPLFFSSQIQDEIDYNGYNIGDLIRFTFNLNMADPFRAIREMKP